MDSSDCLVATSTSPSSNGGNDEKRDLTVIQSKRVRFFNTYQRQDFSLPDSIMFYVIKNPKSADLYEKMIQTCKSFFVKNPILVISDLEYKSYKWYINLKQIDLDKLTSKFWITSEFHVRHKDFTKNTTITEKIASLIIPKIFRCNIKTLILRDQIISFADLSRIISSAEWIYFTNVTVKKADGSIVGIEKIVEIAVKALKILFYHSPSSCITSKTMKQLIEIPKFRNLNCFCMKQLTEVFDIEAFYVYMKKNIHTTFMLDFDNSISDAYKNRLEEIIDKIIATDKFNYKPPRICFSGISEEKENRLYCIQCNN